MGIFGKVPKSMNPLWGLKLRYESAIDNPILCSQKHESSLGIETIANEYKEDRAMRSQKHESSLGIETTLWRDDRSWKWGFPKA